MRLSLKKSQLNDEDERIINLTSKKLGTSNKILIPISNDKNNKSNSKYNENNYEVISASTEDEYIKSNEGFDMGKKN